MADDKPELITGLAPLIAKANNLRATDLNEQIAALEARVVELEKRVSGLATTNDSP
jgi:uncharacterized protein YceH (UPF0502 family)